MSHCLDPTVLKICRIFAIVISIHCIMGKPIDLYHNVVFLVA